MATFPNLPIRQIIRVALWIIAGLCLIAVGLWPWLDNPSFRAWEQAVAPYLGKAHPSGPLWQRADIYLHFWLSMGSTAWIGTTLGFMKGGWKKHLRWLAIPLGILLALSDELLQWSLGKGRSWDVTDFYGDLAGIAVVLGCLFFEFIWVKYMYPLV